MDDLLTDAIDVSDSVCLAAIDAASSPQEIAFRDVLVFHRDFLNGGLSQALFNQRSEFARYLSAYRAIGLSWLADLIELAATYAQDGDSREDFENGDIETLDSAYCAATYGLAYAAELRGETELAPEDRILVQDGDNVERFALRFARANRDAFQSILTAARQ